MNISEHHGGELTALFNFVTGVSDRLTISSDFICSADPHRALTLVLDIICDVLKMEQNWNNYLDVVDIQQNSFSKTFNAALVLEQTQNYSTS